MSTLSKIFLDSSDSENLSIDIVALITSAANDDSPKYTLSEIHDALIEAKVAQYLDPLNTLPSLLPCRRPAAQEILHLMRAEANAKEIVIAIEESLERLHRAALEDEDDDDVQDNESTKKLPLSEQLLRLLLLLQTISRLPFRKKSPADMIRPLLFQLQSTIRDSANRFNMDSGRDSILASAELVNTILDWSTKKEGISTEEIDACKDILTAFVSTAVPTLSGTVKTSLSARAFSLCFPRLAFREVVEPTWEIGNKAMQVMVSVYLRLQGTTPSVSGLKSFTSISSPPNQVFLILYSHWLMQVANDSMPSATTTLSSLEALFPVILSSIQTNQFLEETLCALLLSFNSLQLCKNSTIELSPDLIHPLSTLLPHLAGAHPEPQVRHHTFRVLSMVLRCSPALVRMQLLRNLTGPFETDEKTTSTSRDELAAIEEARRLQMRIAAVGLVKEALMEALQESASPARSTRNIFATPRFLQTFGPVLFRCQPENYFETLAHTVGNLPGKKGDQKYLVELKKELEGEAELTRLVESLSLLYVLLLRDERNLTGIRDKDNIANIERTLLAPIRMLLDELLNADEIEHAHRHAQLHSVMPLVALKLGLERIDNALEHLGLKGT